MKKFALVAIVLFAAFANVAPAFASTYSTPDTLVTDDVEITFAHGPEGGTTNVKITVDSQDSTETVVELYPFEGKKEYTEMYVDGEEAIWEGSQFADEDALTWSSEYNLDPQRPTRLYCPKGKTFEIYVDVVDTERVTVKANGQTLESWLESPVQFQVRELPWTYENYIDTNLMTLEVEHEHDIKVGESTALCTRTAPTFLAEYGWIYINLEGWEIAGDFACDWEVDLDSPDYDLVIEKSVVRENEEISLEIPIKGISKRREVSVEVGFSAPYDERYDDLGDFAVDNHLTLTDGVYRTFLPFISK